MTVTLEITELSKYAKCIEYINGVEGHITVKMVSKQCNVNPKMAKYALRVHDNTMLCKPIHYGSRKYKNYNLFKKITDEEKQKFCDIEVRKLKQTKYSTNYNGINFAISNYLFKHYRINSYMQTW